ncbi:unnamed protein product [Arabidopsis halleri]
MVQERTRIGYEKANDVIKNLQCLPPSGFRSALKDMVIYDLEKIYYFPN